MWEHVRATLITTSACKTALMRIPARLASLVHQAIELSLSATSSQCLGLISCAAGNPLQKYALEGRSGLLLGEVPVTALQAWPAWTTVCAPTAHRLLPHPQHGPMGGGPTQISNKKTQLSDMNI